jgi:hypothetical protein
MTTPDRATGPKSVEEKLQELLRRIREAHPPAAMPLPPAAAPAPPRPFSEVDDEDQEAP